MKRVLLALVAMGIFSPVIHAQQNVSRNTSIARPRIIFGKVVPSKNSAIVQVREKQGNDSALCTGTVIAPYMVLTAWHCVSTRASDMTVVAGGKRLRVRRIFTHPEVRTDEENGLVYNDVAILRLSKKVDITPVPIVLSRQAAISDPVTILGYGLTEFGSAGTLRQGLTQIDDVTKDFIVTLFGNLESNSCSGDSGGPALLSFVGNDGRTKTGIVGTTSTGTNTSCFYGDQTSYINIQSPAVYSFILINAPRAKTI